MTRKKQGKRYSFKRDDNGTDEIELTGTFSDDSKILIIVPRFPKDKTLYVKVKL